MAELKDGHLVTVTATSVSVSVIYNPRWMQGAVIALTASGLCWADLAETKKFVDLPRLAVPDVEAIRSLHCDVEARLFFVYCNGDVFRSTSTFADNNMALVKVSNQIFT